MAVQTNPALPTFWSWFFRGAGGKPGIQRIVNLWLLVHVCVGLTSLFWFRGDLKSAANSVLLPLAGALIGMTFAWAGNASALLQSEEMETLSSYHPGGFADYVFTYQLAIFLVLMVLVGWGAAGLGLFDEILPTRGFKPAYLLVQTSLFSASSVAVRECWHAVLGAQMMLLIRHQMRDVNRRRSR